MAGLNYSQVWGQWKSRAFKSVISTKPLPVMSASEAEAKIEVITKYKRKACFIKFYPPGRLLAMPIILNLPQLSREKP